MPSASPSSERAFVDTNVFAYTQDLRDPAKRAAALALLDELTGARRAVISTQVLNELCSILLRGRVGPVPSEEELLSLVQELEASAEVVVLTPAIIREAVRGLFAYRFSWFDALIWASAKAGGCAVIYTEDTPGMSPIEGVRYENPFNPASKLPDTPQASFGGFNLSGTDSKAGGRDYLGFFVQAKSVTERW